MSVVGIDLGTSGVRAVLFGRDGVAEAAATRALVLSRPAEGRVELDAEEVVAAAEAVVAEVAQRARESGDDVQAVAFSVLGEAVVPVDEAGHPLAPVAVSMDTRGAPAARALGEAVGAERFTGITGQPLHGMFSVFKIVEGDAVWQDAAGYRCMGDLLTQRWTGRPVIDASQAARTGLLDVSSGGWSDELLAAVAPRAPWIRRTALSEVVPGGTIAARIGAPVAERLGLPVGTPVVAGAHDQAAAYLGAGGAPGIRSVIAFGSSDCVTTGSDARPRDLGSTGFATYRVDERLWVTLAGTAAGGWALEWFAATLGREVADVFGDLSPRPPALLVLPYLAGSGTLDNDPDARGVVHGLTLETTVPELARAVVEASGFEFAKILAAFADRGVETGELAVTGAGARNAAALAARAAAAGRTLTPTGSDASARGAAILAARGIGLDPAVLGSAATAGDPQSPDAAHAAWYGAQRRAYIDLYESTRDVARHLANPPD